MRSSRHARPSLLPLLAAAASALALTASPRDASADCNRLTRPLANRLSAAVRPRAPEWARPLLTAAQLVRFDAQALHEMTYVLGYGVITLERLGTNGAPPYNVTAVVRCRDNRVELVSDPYAWASARARELHISIANAEQAAGYAAEVVSLRIGRRPDGANASRRGPVFNVDVSLAPRQGDPSGAPQILHVEVTRDGQIQLMGPSSTAPVRPG